MQNRVSIRSFHSLYKLVQLLGHYRPECLHGVPLKAGNKSARE